MVDPRFSIAASKAKHYLPIKPGTDLALLLAWMHVLVSEELYDKAYVEKHGFGFERFKAEIAPYTPEWAYPETGIEPALIRDDRARDGAPPARDARAPRPALAWYGNDTQRSRAVALVNALLGSWGRKGGFYVPGRDGHPAATRTRLTEAGARRGRRPGRRVPVQAASRSRTGIREATITGAPYPIKGWMVYGTNLIESLPNQAETIKAIQNLDLLVVVDVVPSEITGWADVVLPEAVYLERHDELNLNWFREPYVGMRQPVVEPPADQKPNWWIARELALKLGLGATSPGRTSRSTSRTASRRPASTTRAEAEGHRPGRAAADLLRRGRAGGVPDALGEDRVLLAAAARQGLRPGAELHAARGRRRRARSACSSGARRCTRSAARRPTRSSTT